MLDVGTMVKKHTKKSSSTLVKKEKRKTISKDSILEELESKGLAKTSESIASDRHPWRLCPPGQHWRRPNIQGTYTRPSDGVTVNEHSRNGGCCENPSGKDQIYSDEMVEIAKNFLKLKDRDRPGLLDPKYYRPYDPTLFDDYIAG